MLTYPFKKHSSQGFTIIELLVGIGITAFLLMMTMPGINRYLVDTKIRAAAQAFYDGAQLARSEALRRNLDVAISLMDSNQGWAVSYVPAPNADAITLSSKSPESASTLTITAGATGVTFNSQGFASVANTVQFASGDSATCVANGGAQRCLNVIVSRGGQVRICDPSVSAAGDNRKC
jgi:type IV fimbrial biogenesis protein FimT